MAETTDSLSQDRPTFGSELKDQIPTINQYLVNGISFLNDFRDFCKERSVIEKDYAHRMEALVKKYQHKRDKKLSTSASISGVPVSPVETEFDSSGNGSIGGGSDGTTTFKAWNAMLSDTDAACKDRLVYADCLVANVAEPLKILAIKKDEARKKHITFAQKLMSERDRAAMERDKSKARYDTSCEEVESSKHKQERAYDEKNQEKLKRSYFQDILDMNNNKNVYVLAVQVFNAVRRKYYDIDLPELSNRMQELNESRIEGLKSIWELYINLDSKLTTDTQRHLGTMLEAVQSVDATADSIYFMKTQRRAWTAPADHPFESSSVFNDTDELVNDENAKVFLSNKQMKLRRNLAQVTVEITGRRKDLEGLQNLKDAYLGNRSLGDPEDVNENIIDTHRAITILQTMQTIYETEINSIVHTMGDGGVQNQPHDFKAASFTIPTSCDYCQSTIWGIAKQGFTCRDCGYNCHSKCEMKVPPNCSNVKGGAKAQRNSMIVPSPTASSFLSVKTGTGAVAAGAGAGAGAAVSATPTGAGGSNVSSSVFGDQSLVVSTPVSITGSSGSPSTSSFVREAGSSASMGYQQAQVIYDYEATGPAEMSVTAGELVNILEGDDGSGWLRCGVGSTRVGLVPASYVELEQFYEAASEIQTEPEQQVRALYDYDAQSDLELTIREGDIITLTSTECSEGWWEGRLNGIEAQFPASYVERI